MTRPQDPAAAGRDQLRAGHADRERVIEALKTAFVRGQLTRDELGMRAGQALAARTGAELAALTADIPGGPAQQPAPVRDAPARSCAGAVGRWRGRRPGRAAAWASRSPPCGLPPASSIRMAWEIPITPGASCA